MNNYFNLNDSIYNILNKYPNLIEIFVLYGFQNFTEKSLVESLGKTLTLEMALSSKNIDKEVFTRDLVKSIESKDISNLIRSKSDTEAQIKIDGVLPCPVTLPLMEGFEDFLEKNKSDIKVEYNLKVASGGVNWIKDKLVENNSLDDMADLFISAGFDLFFDKDLMGKYREENLFKDILSEARNKEFFNEEIDLKDPRGEYSIIGLVPAIFLVNKEEIGARPYPKKWSDLFSEDFVGEVALPVGDFDLFNAILLNIYKLYGERGVALLGRSFMNNMHPSEMVKSYRQKEKPTITIMPYFFTKMITGKGPMMPIWPEDGSIVSPIFLLAKRSKEEDLKDFVNFFGSKQVGEILSVNGKFPSTHGEVDNRLDKSQKFMWLGWDYIEENDIASLIKKCEDIFYNWRDYQWN